MSKIKSYHEDKTVMTNSRFWGYMECPAAQKAKDSEDYKQEYYLPFHIGQYVEAGLIDSEVDYEEEMMYKRKNPENGKLKAFVEADEIIANAKEMKVDFSGEHQKEINFELDGLKWKGMIDIFRDMCLDIKTTKNSIMDLDWDDTYGTKVPRYIKYHYGYQLALYAHGTGTLDKGAGIIALSKTAPYTVEKVKFTPETLEEFLNDIRERQQAIFDIFEGKVKAKPCMKCDYCKEQYRMRNYTAEMHYPLKF
jgi:hypothetical protein